MPLSGLAWRPALAKLAELDVRHLQLDWEFADLPPTAESVTPAAARQIARAARELGIEIVAVSAYTNLVDPDLDRGEAAWARFRALAAAGADLGARWIVTATGSFHPENQWLDHPENHTPAGRARGLERIARAAGEAVRAGPTLLIEPYVHNVIDSVAAAAEALDHVGERTIGLLLDPCNYLGPGERDLVAARIDEIFERLEGWIRLAHAKDIRFVEGAFELPGPGAGDLDYPRYLARLAGSAPAVPLLVEHVTVTELPGALAFTREAVQRARRGGASA
jgi:sugar phosphate isomerase/epimerase